MQVSKVWRFVRGLAGRGGRSASTEAAWAETGDAALLEADEAELARAEAAVEAARNKSGLQPQHYNAYHGRAPYAEPAHMAHFTLDYQRRMFARFGYASGIDPAICWMAKDILEDKKEYEALAHPRTIQEMVKMIRDKRAEEKLEIIKREETIELNLVKMEKFKEAMHKRIEKKASEAKAIKEKKDRLIEEVRRYFGFKVDSKDERFKVMLEEKELEQKKAEKLLKRQAKEAQYLLKLQQKGSEIS